MEVAINPSCNTATLDPYVPNTGNPWNADKIKHIYKRLGFGITIADIDGALAQAPNALIDNLVDSAFNLPPTDAPPYANWSYSDFTDFETENNEYVFAWRIQSGNDLISEGLRGRLVSFWMNHFVTELETYYYSPYMYQYYNLMQVHALGNFKNFTSDIGESNAMLIYLNGFENTNFSPNENYARELFELFTLGEGNNYTQTDITEAAKALTGYNHWVEPGGDIYFDSTTFDDSIKTVFEQTGPLNYEGLIDLLFTARSNEIAVNICRKLYTYFVSPAVDQVIEDNIITPLAQTFIDNNWELAPVLKQLFKSEHFFDERAVGVIVKSPFDLIFGYINQTNFHYEDSYMEAFLYFAGIVGQEIYDPPDVSGWQRDETWINSSTLTGRWQLMEYYLWTLYGNGFEFSLVDLARDLSNDSNDPAYITQVVIDHFVSKPLYTVTDYDVATDVFKWDVPQNYYDDGTWNLSWESAPYQCVLLLIHLARIPEFQLK